MDSRIPTHLLESIICEHTSLTLYYHIVLSVFQNKIFIINL